MHIIKLDRTETEDLKTQFKLQGLSQVGVIKFDLIRVTIPERLPLKIDETLSLVDTHLYAGTTDTNKAILFGDFFYLSDMIEEDVLSLVDRYEIEDASVCYVDRFYYDEMYQDFVSSPMFPHVWLFSNADSQEEYEEEEYYDD